MCTFVLGQHGRSISIPHIQKLRGSLRPGLELPDHALPFPCQRTRHRKVSQASRLPLPSFCLVLPPKPYQATGPRPGQQRLSPTQLNSVQPSSVQLNPAQPSSPTLPAQPCPAQLSSAQPSPAPLTHSAPLNIAQLNPAQLNPAQLSPAQLSPGNWECKLPAKGNVCRMIFFLHGLPW